MRYSKKLLIKYLAILILLVISRLILLVNYNFQYVGSDDLIFWQAANDYSQGVFHEPYFYGQNYNFMIEALFAVPLLWFGVPIYIALPIVTSFIFLFPFVLFSYVFFRKDKVLISLIFLIVPLAMPVEYDIMTSITRGFVSAFFTLSFLIFPIINPNKKSSFLIFGIFSSISFVINPSSILFSLLVGCFLLMENYKNAKFYIITISSFVPILLVEYFSKKFYMDNPEFLVHNSVELEFSLEVFLNSISNLDKYFKYLTPVFWMGNWIVILLILLGGFAAYVKSKSKGISIFLTFLFIILTLGINKVNDGIGSVFLSSVRMFLVVPLIFSVVVYWSITQIQKERHYINHLVAIGVVIFLIKISVIPTVVKKETNKLNLGPIANAKLDILKKEVLEINEIAINNNVDLILFVPGGKYNVPKIELYNYSFNYFTNDKINTVMLYDRRTWAFNKAKNEIKHKVLILGDYNYVNSNYDKENLYQIECIESNNDILIVYDNEYKTEDLTTRLGFKFKRKIYD